MKDNEKTIQDILERLEKLESKVFPNSGEVFEPVSPKQKTITEMLRGKKFTNGQQKVAFIIGYYEKILKKAAVTVTDIKQGWREAKFDNDYAPMLLARAQKEGLVHDYDKNGDYCLTQSGESFFESQSK